MDEATDLEARVLALESRLRESDERYSLVVEHAPEAIVVLDTAQGRFVTVNVAAERLFGMTRTELLQVGPLDVSPAEQPDGRPSADAAHEYIERAIAGELPEFEWVHRRADGAEMLCRIRLLALPSETGGPLVRGSIVDITSIREQELRTQELEREHLQMAAAADLAQQLSHLYLEAREAESRFRELAEHAPVMIWMSAAHDHTWMEYANPSLAGYTGRSREEELGDSWIETVHPDDREWFLERSATAHDRREPYEAEYRVRRADGTYGTVSERAAPRFSEDGTFLGFIGVGVDVTLQRQAEERERLDRERTDALEGFARMLAEGGTSEEVADVALDGALEVLGARFGALGVPTADGRALSLRRQRGFDDKLAEWASMRLDADTPPARCFVRGEPLFFRDGDALGASFPDLAGGLVTRGARAAMPLLGRNGPLGVLYVAFDEPIEFDASTSGFFREVADRIARNLERATLFEAASRAAAEIRLLQSITADLSAAVTVEDIQRVALRSARDAVSADASLIGSIDHKRGRLQYHEFDTYPPELMRLLPTSLAPGSSPAADAIALGESLTYRTSAEIVEAYPALEDMLTALEFESRIFVPIVGSGEALGMMVASSRHPGRFGADEARLLESIARICGQSMERAAFYRDARRSAERSASLQVATLALAEARSDDVPDTILRCGMTLAGAGLGGLALTDPDAAALRASRWAGVSPEVVERWAEMPQPSGASPSPDSSGRRTFVVDALSLPDEHPLATELETLGLGSLAILPLVSGGAIQGVLALGLGPEAELEPADHSMLDAFAERAAASLHRAELQDSETAIRQELQGVLSRLSRLQGVTTALGTAVRKREVAEIVLEATNEALGGMGGSVFEAAGDELRLLAARGITTEPPWELEIVSVSADMAMCEAFRTGHVVWVPTVDEWTRRYPDGARLFRDRAGSTIAIPFTLEDRVLGCITILFERERELSRSERRLARTIGEQAAQAFERARLYDLEVRRVEHTEQLQRLSAELATSATPEDIADVLTHLGAEVVGAQAAIVALLDEERDEVQIVSASGFPDDLLDRLRVSPLEARRPGNDVMRSGRASFLRTPEEIAARYPDLPPRGPAVDELAWATLPLTVAGIPIGSVHFSYPEPQDFSAVERAELNAMVNEAALAMDRARMFAREREASLVLQESLLPRESVSAWRGSDVVARYWAGARHLEVGGDWYDVIPLPGGRLGLSIGDVVGRGLKAAAAMGQLRSALRSLALEGRGPSATIRGLDRFAASTPGTELATVVYAELDPDTRELRYACAGHPPPVALIEGRAELLEAGRSPLLAAGYEGPREEASIVLPPGSTVVLYTDGLVERRGEPIDDGIRRLEGSLEAAGRIDLDTLSDRIAADLLGEEEQHDDVAFLCVRVGAASDTLTVRVPSDPSSLRELRRAVEGWALAQQMSPSQVEAAVLAVNEAASNSIEHGYRDGRSGEIAVEAQRERHRVSISVRDRGLWRQGPPEPNRGRGLLLVRALMDTVRIERDPEGTTMRLSMQLDAETRGPQGTPSMASERPSG